MDHDQKKSAAAEAALAYVEVGDVVGVGTGTTVNHFIDFLGRAKGRIDGAGASSEETADRLSGLGIRLLDLNHLADVPLYVDGADEATSAGYLIKGGGGALTREKIVACASRKFVCVMDNSKLVKMLGEFPLPVEVIPMARSLVGRRLVAYGGLPEFREGFESDNGNVVLDVRNLPLSNPHEMEKKINNIPGVVENGIFAERRADILLISGENGVECIET